jgi:prevent-host-death family protein
MSTIGIRELKANTSQILRRVREKGESIEITYHGEVIAQLVPVKRTKASRKKIDAFWSDWDQLAAEIGREWKGTPSAVEAVREGRR